MVRFRLDPSRRSPARDLLAATASSLFVFWLFFWLAKRMGIEARGVSKLVELSTWLDVRWYLEIADRGYWLDPRADQNPTVFFPLWPALIAATRSVTGLATATAAFWLQRLVAVACVFALVTYARRMHERSPVEPTGGRAARPSPHEFALFVLLQPAAVFLIVPYPEALYLALLALLLAAYRSPRSDRKGDRGSLAILFGLSFLLGTCRPNGLFLGVAAGLAVLAAIGAGNRRYGELAPLLVLAAGTTAATVAVAAVAERFTGNALAFFTERAGWNESPGARSLWRVLAPELGGGRTMEILVLYAVLAGAVLLWRSELRLESIYCFLCVLLPAYWGKAGDMSRYALAAVPALFALQKAMVRRPVGYLLAWSCSCMVAVVIAYRFLSRQWPG